MTFYPDGTRYFLSLIVSDCNWACTLPRMGSKPESQVSGRGHSGGIYSGLCLHYEFHIFVTHLFDVFSLQLKPRGLPPDPICVICIEFSRLLPLPIHPKDADPPAFSIFYTDCYRGINLIFIPRYPLICDSLMNHDEVSCSTISANLFILKLKFGECPISLIDFFVIKKLRVFLR